MLTELITPANVRAALERAGQAVGFNQLGAIISIDGDLVSIAFTTSSARAASKITQAAGLDNLARVAVIRAVRSMEKKP